MNLINEIKNKLNFYRDRLNAQENKIEETKDEQKEILKAIKKIEIKTKKISNEIFQGIYRSTFKGNGLDFAQIREYHQGDDIRNIDWNVTARYNKPFLKEFEEERNINIYFVFDFSASNFFGDIIEKKRKAIELSSNLMFSANNNRDNVGCIIFSEIIEKYIPPKKGKKHILSIIKTLTSIKPKHKKTNIENVLNFIIKVIKKRSIIIFLSDFYDIQKDSVKKKISFLNKKHDLILIKINDKKEFEIPSIGWLRLEDYETGEQILVNSSDEQFRKNYEKIIEQENKKINQFLKKLKVDFISIFTNDDYYLILNNFFKKRIRQRV